MKFKFLVMLIICFFYRSMVMANPVGIEQAQRVAQEFLNTRISNAKSLKKSPLKGKSLKLAHRVNTHSGKPAFYVFDSGENGFVIVSGDDRANRVLGYSNSGSFDKNNIPTNLKGLLEAFTRQLEFIENNSQTKGYRRVRSEWNDVAPMLVTKWDQDGRYNALCPIDPATGERCITGCVATAISQIMYFHHFPDVGRGVMSYKWKGQDITLDLSKMRFDWENMDDENDDNNAIAKLIYSVAVVSESDFSPNNTSGWFDNVRLYKYFNYKDSMGFADFNNMTLEEIEATIYNDLVANRPVLFWSADPSDDSHVMVIDGYNSKNGLFHINFGWGGIADGYYSLTAIDVDYYNFTSPEAIVYNIEPDHNVPIESGIYSSSSYKLSDDVKTLYEWTGSETEIDMHADACFWNVGYISSDAFKNNNTLRFVNLPANLTDLGDKCFDNCSELQTVYIPESVNNVKASSFYNCRNLTNIMVSEDNIRYSVDSGILLNKEKSSVIYCGGGILGKVQIPSGVNKIEDGAFENSQICSIVFPESLTRIGYEAFLNCTGITTFRLPVSLEYIDSYAFSGCAGVKQIVALGMTPPRLGADVFRDIDLSNATLCVPEESIEAYRYADGWRGFKTIVGVAKPEAKKLVVFTTDGSVAEFYLSQDPFIKNIGGALELVYGGNKVSFEQKSLVKMMFMNEGDVADAISNLVEERQNGQREVINFSQLPPRSRIEIFDVSGKLLRKERVGESSKALKLNELGKGAFLIKVNGITYKVSRQ